MYKKIVLQFVFKPLCFFSLLLLTSVGSGFASDCTVPVFSKHTTNGLDGPGNGVAVGDLNHDGKLDMVAASGIRSDGGVKVLWGDGTGNFPVATNFATEPAFVMNVLIADLNGDGNPDFGARTYTRNLYVFLGDGAGHFSAPQVTGVQMLAGQLVPGDFNNDGVIDIAANTPTLSSIYLFLGNNTGSFQSLIQIPTQGPPGITAGDFDEDGRLDIIATVNGGVVLIKNSNGQFVTSPIFGVSSAGPMAARINQDNHLDVVAATANGAVAYLGDGTGHFTTISSPGSRLNDYAFGVRTIGDVSGDGNIDLIGGSYIYAYTVSLGDGEGHFTPPVAFLSPWQNTIVVEVGDFDNLVDNSGRLDIVSTSYGNSVDIYLNQGNVPEAALLVPSNTQLEATGPTGAVFNYPLPNYGNPFPYGGGAAFFSIASGSTFPFGSTAVNYVASDSCGNSLAGSFTVSVVDTTAPALSLPGTIFTDATSVAGAPVNYVASANDAVAGDVPITCLAESGSVFPVGETIVTCTATDSANNAASGDFKVAVLTSDQEVIMPGREVPVTSSDSGLSLLFFQVEQPGVTTIAPIDPGTIGTTPSGFAVSDVAYEISTTSAGSTEYGVELAFVVPNSAGMTRSDFELLRVLHNTNGTLEDITSGYDYDNRIVYALTYSFSPFYLARKVTTKIETLFDRSTAYKAGSTIPVKIRVRDSATNTNLSTSSFTVTARSVKRLGDTTSAQANDSGAANPDSNFRYLGEKDGGSYIFNLSTKGCQAGFYALSFYIGNDRSFFFTVKFEVK